MSKPMTDHCSVFSPPCPTQTGDKIFWGNLDGGATPLAISQAAPRVPGPLLVIANSVQEANRLEEELKIFSHNSDFPVFHFPDWETLPFDTFSPHQDITSDRLKVLSQLPNLSKGIIIIPLSTLLHNLPPLSFVDRHSLVLKVGDHFNLDTVRLRLADAGYNMVSQVVTHGEFSVRGSIIDIFPMGFDSPVRIDLFDTDIDSLRLFDPQTQRSTTKIEELLCLPAKEFPLTQDSISLFRQRWREQFGGDGAKCPMYEAVTEGRPLQGIEYYLPLFFEDTHNLFDYLPKNTTLIRAIDTDKQCESFWHDVDTRYEQYRHDIERPILPPSMLFIRPDAFFSALSHFRQIIVQKSPFEKEHAGKINFNLSTLPDIAIDSRSQNPLNKLSRMLSEVDAKVLVCAESAGRRETLIELLKRANITPRVLTHWEEVLESVDKIHITVAPLETGAWILGDTPLLLIAESQLYGQQVMQRRRREKVSEDMETPIRDLSELTLGASVVHIDHGVGRYRGLTHLTVDSHQAEYLVLEYANNDKLYVPVSALHLISQYSGAHLSNAPLHKLGTDHWDKAKKKAAQKAFDVAAELLDVYAKRASKKGHRLSADEHYDQFAGSFPFEETPDQAQSIGHVLNDMRSDKPMDRLVCGDVGFGKTEVALRAAFVATQNAKQVAVLVPTTLLAQQHFETFSDRFADWPIRVDVMSRFRSAKEQAEIMKDLQNGKIDILIGTHKLLSESVQFNQLGLLIIDEEHRFGVRQKERIKAMRSQVDILTLTATPIPRTLNMAFASLRDLSIIATPPARRLSIKTFVKEYQQAQVNEAILRELMRGGQVYFLHNDIDTIEKVAQTLRENIPQANVGVAHGQMRERQLEKIMSDFYHQRFNVLVCTTIIETGIDIPSANTIIIDRADKFGLAQLHQLRGRVGRSHHQAYAYCMTPPQKSLTPDANKRLDALASSEELGSGFTLATHDLEIRGAGELLGEEQSGNINAVGYSLYMELLEKAVQSLKSGKQPSLDAPLHQSADIDLHLSALIPESYLPDVHSRLILYKRIASATSHQALNDLQVEMIDRFGLLPEETKTLFKVTAFKLNAQAIGIQKLRASSQQGKIEFIETPNISPTRIIEMIKTQPKHFKLTGSSQVSFKFDMTKPQDRLDVVEKILHQLQPEQACTSN